MTRVMRLAALLVTGLVTIASANAPQGELREVDVGLSGFVRGAPLPAWADPLPLPEDDATGPVVMRLVDTHFFAGDNPAVLVSRAIQVNDAAALAQIGQQYIPFVPEYQTLKLHSLRILRGGRAMDRTASANVRFLQRESGLEQGVYSGVVTAAFLIDDVRAGDTLHLVYSVEGDNPVFAGKYSTFSAWDDAQPIRLRRITLTHPASRPIQWKVLGDRPAAAIAPQVDEIHGLRRLRFLARDLPAVELEPQLPESYDAYRLIQFSEYADWNEVARWAMPFFESRTELPAEVRDLVQRLRALPSRDAQISAALQWVQSEIRYFSVSLGQSSHRPYPPATVLERRYGDCKDKSLLLISLLRELGIEANAVLVHASMKNGPGKILPTPLAFDHVMVAVEGGRFHLDPTRLGQRGRLDRMGQPLEGADVLDILPGSVGLRRIETPNIAELVRTEIEEKVTLARFSGSGDVEIRKTFNGAHAESIRAVLPRLTAAQLHNLALRGFEHRYPDASTAQPQVSDDTEHNRITIVSRFHAGKVILPVQQSWRVPFSPANFSGAFPIPEGLRRTLPLGVPTHPFEARYALEVLWPETVNALREPFSERIDTPYFQFRIKGTFRGSRARYELALQTRAAAIDAASVREAREEIRKVSRIADSSIVISRGEMAPEVIRFGGRAAKD